MSKFLHEFLDLISETSVIITSVAYTFHEAFFKFENAPKDPSLTLPPFPNAQR